MTPVKVGQVYGKLRVLAKNFDGRWRVQCLLCRSDSVLVSEQRLLRCRACYDCHQKAMDARAKQRPAPIQQPIPIRPKLDDMGWTIREAA